jgi:hypothetical protein
MAEVSPDGTSRDDHYRNENWHLANHSHILPELPPLAKISARIEHTLNCPTPRPWRALTRDLLQMIVSSTEQQQNLVEVLLQHQGSVYDTGKKYDRDTNRVFDVCNKILEHTLSAQAQLSPAALSAIVTNCLPHIQKALCYQSNSTLDLGRAFSYSQASLKILSLALAHIEKNPAPENLELKNKIALFFDLVVFDPAIIEDSKLDNWRSPQIYHYSLLVEFSSKLCEQRLSKPICKLWKHIDFLKNEIALKQSDSDAEDERFTKVIENAAMLEKATLKALSTAHQGPNALHILEKSWSLYSPGSNEFRTILLGLAQTDIAETREACEYLALALLEHDKHFRRSLVKSSLQATQSNFYEIDSHRNKYEKILTLTVNYLSHTGAVDIFYSVASQLVAKERAPLTTILKIVEQNDASSFYNLLPSSSDRINLPILTDKDSKRLKLLIECLEKLPKLPFLPGQTHVSRYIE